MYHISPRQTLFGLDYDGGHIGKWLHILSQVKSAICMYVQGHIFAMVFSNCVPNVLLVSQNAHFHHKCSHICCTKPRPGNESVSNISLEICLTSQTAAKITQCKLYLFSYAAIAVVLFSKKNTNLDLPQPVWLF